MIHLQLCGVPQVTAEGIELRAVLAQPKRFALLVYLATAEPHGFHRRDSLLALFWPERPDDAARAALSRAVYHLRQALGDEVIVSGAADEIGINSAMLTSDLVSFESLRATGKLVEAMDVYRGDVLPGFHLDDVPEFMQWLDVLRTKQRAAAANAALQLCKQANARGDLVSATTWGATACELAPYDEQTAQLLLETLARQEKRTDALLAYDGIVRRLATDLKVTPSPALQALAMRLRSGERVDAGPNVSANPQNVSTNGAHVDADRETQTSAAAATLPQPVRTANERPSIARPWAAVAGVSILLLAGAAFVSFRGTSAARMAIAANFAVDLPDSATLAEDAPSPIAIDRAGQQVAVVVVEKDGRRAIYRRRVDETALARVTGTDGALAPVFSPDGKFLAFNVAKELRIVPVEGGTPRTLASEAGVYKVWTDDERIVYDVRMSSLWIVSASGGAPRRIPPPDSARRVVVVVPVQMVNDGTQLLVDYYHVNIALDSMRTALVSLDDGRFVDLDHEVGYWGLVHGYSATGHLLMSRLGGTLYAMPYDLRARSVSGPPHQLLEHVNALSMSDNGTLAYHDVRNLHGVDPVNLYTVDLQGRETPLTSAPEHFAGPRISSDGQRVALKRTHYTYGPTWTFDIASQHFTVLIGDSTAQQAEWSVDGTHVYYVQGTKDSTFIRATWVDRRRPDSVLAARPKAAGGFGRLSVSRTGDVIVKQGGGSETPTSAIAFVGNEVKRGSRPLRQPPETRFGLPTLSPDGQWLAYQSDERGEQGQNDVFVTSTVTAGPSVRVSAGGGTEPAWTPDGNTIFYRSRAKVMMAARITTQPLAVVRRDSLFPDRYFRDAWLRNYDVMPDGKHLLMMRDTVAPLTPRSSARVVTNWPALLKAK